MGTAAITRIKFKPTVRKDEYAYTAICNELKIAAAGANEDEATARLMAMIRSFCLTLQRKGLLEKALATSGIETEPSSLPRHDGELCMDIETP